MTHRVVREVAVDGDYKYYCNGCVKLMISSHYYMVYVGNDHDPRWDYCDECIRITDTVYDYYLEVVINSKTYTYYDLATLLCERPEYAYRLAKI
jgi:hypothetical protein